MFKPTAANAALNGPAYNGKRALAQIFAKLILLVSALAAGSAWAAERISAVRVWPAQDYTRITIEADRPIRHEMLLVKNPDRLVLDLEGVDFASVQREIADKVLPSDPYIAQMRAGRYKPGVVRMVLDLKTEVRPQIFMLDPVGDYGYRLELMSTRLCRSIRSWRCCRNLNCRARRERRRRRRAAGRAGAVRD